MIRKTLAILAASAAAVTLAAGPASAADTLDFWNGASTSGQCGAATFLGSQKIDNPHESGISQAGTIEKYKRTCSYPTSANQTCWNTRAKAFIGTSVGAGVEWIGQDSNVEYSLIDTGAVVNGWVSSPVICAHQVEGLSWGAWARIDGKYATLYN